MDLETVYTKIRKEENDCDQCGKPFRDGAEGLIYLAPIVSRDERDNYLEWVFINGQWECIGTTQSNFESIAPATIESISEGGSYAGTDVLTLTGLSYLWSRVKAKFAQKFHTHSASDITDGYLSGAYGGTGMPLSEEGEGFVYKGEGADYCRLQTYVETDMVNNGAITREKLEADIQGKLMSLDEMCFLRITPVPVPSTLANGVNVVAVNPVQVPGYSPVAIAGYSLTHNYFSLICLDLQIGNDQAYDQIYARVKNTSSGTSTETINVRLLYVKNGLLARS